jgi:hypothetical protein
MFNFGMLLETAPAAGAGTEASPLGNIGTTAIMIVVLVAVFYLFMIRPENKKKKKLKETRRSHLRREKTGCASRWLNGRYQR